MPSVNAPPGAPQPPSLRWLRQAVCFFAGLLCLLDAHAHLMVAQRGTLNLVGDGGYLVLSVPVSALRGFDDDGDGLMSGPELQAHAPAIRAQLVDGVQLLGNTGAVPLEGLLMTLSPADDRPDAPARQVVMLGRFTVSPDAPPYRLRVTLFGSAADESQIDLVVTRQAEKQLIRLHRGNDTQAVLPGRLAVLAEAFVMGLEHIASGPDHKGHLAPGPVRNTCAVLSPSTGSAWPPSFRGARCMWRLLCGSSRD